MSIDPTNITNFNLSNEELQKTILWWVVAAGKNGVTAARCVEKLLVNLKTRHGDLTPFELVKREQDLAQLMRQSGIGCYNIKSKTFLALACSGLDLRTCTVDELEEIKGIGPKTSRCFIIHSRPNQRFAGLDRHILTFLRSKGYDVPKSTPTGKKYKQIEQWFISEADKAGKTIAEFDLELWNRYRNK